MDQFNSKHNSNFLTPTQLKNLLARAQAFDQHAIDTLCAAFAPLVSKEARRAGVSRALGEDAVNIAWEIFLEFIYKYRGGKYRLLPGLIQKHLYYGLLHRLHQQGCLQDCAALDADADLAETLADSRNCISRCEDKITLQNAVEKLSPAQKKVIEALYFREQSLEECSTEQRISLPTCSTYKRRALQQLRKNLTE